VTFPKAFSTSEKEATSRIAIDDEHVAALGVYDDAIGAVFGFDARQNFEGLEVERYRLTCTAIISIALAPGR
jgi:hypothetical protein